MSHFKCMLSDAMGCSDKITFDGYEVEFWRHDFRERELALDIETGNTEVLKDQEIEVIDGEADIELGFRNVRMTFQRLYNLTMEDLR